MGEAAARKWVLLAQNICFQQWVLSFNKFIFIQEFLPSKKIFVHPRSFDGKFSNQHLGPPPTSKEERVGKVWLATNTSLLPATIIQVVNMWIVWKSCLVKIGEGHPEQVWFLNCSGGRRRSFSEARSRWWGANCAKGFDLPGAHCSWWSKKLTVFTFYYS